MKHLFTLVSITCLFVFIYSGVSGQSFGDKRKIRKACKLYKDKNTKDSKFWLNSVKKAPGDKNRALDYYLMYKYLVYSHNIYQGRYQKYTVGTNKDSVLYAISTVDTLLGVIDSNRVRRPMKLDNKFGINRNNLKEVRRYFLSLQDTVVPAPPKDPDDIEEEIERRIREKEINDSLQKIDVRKLRKQELEQLGTLAASLNPDKLDSEIGQGYGKTIDVKIVDSVSGKDRVIKFTLAYQSEHFKPGTYKSIQTDAVLRKTFNFLEDQVLANQYYLKIWGTADDLYPESLFYKVGSSSIGKISNYQYYDGLQQIGANQISLVPGQKINNTHLAFLRACNAELIMKANTELELNELIVIDYLKSPNKEIGDEFRTVSFVLVISNYYADRYNEFDAKIVNEILNRSKVFRYEQKDGQVHVLDVFLD